MPCHSDAPIYEEHTNMPVACKPQTYAGLTELLTDFCHGSDVTLVLDNNASFETLGMFSNVICVHDLTSRDVLYRTIVYFVSDLRGNRGNC